MKVIDKKPPIKILALKLRSYLFTGILITAPVVITLWIVLSLVKVFDRLVTPLIPTQFNPNQYLPYEIPGIGLIVLITFLIIIGFLTANFFGRWIVKRTEIILQNIPLIKVFYKTIKQILETVLKNNSNAFRKVVLVEYPRKGLWIIGFTTGETSGLIRKKIGTKLTNVFIPTTPNPTSGFLLLVPEKELKYLEIGVDDAIKTVVSAGIVPPVSQPVK
ncbi:MAG: hypothetical protein CMP37_02140 [Rickettsiales bacterium]|nr:hypothetical protein [Rickettsiales bacterium]OUW72044.1 MAG: hypothetical protein CBD71_02030 [Rickettsiales bacterium TMED211]